MIARLAPWVLIPLAAVLGFLAGNAGGTIRPAQHEADRGREDAGPARPAAAEGAPEPRDPATSRARVLTLDDVVRFVTARAAKGRLADPPPSTLTIKGTVRDEEGAPVAGALVRATPDLSRDYFPDDDEPDAVKPMPSLEEAVREQVETLDLGESRFAREARTGPDGAFEIGDLRDVKYDVEAWTKGFEVDTKDYSDRDDVSPGATIGFTAYRLVTVTIDVRKGDGAAQRAFVYSEDEDYDPFEYEWSATRLTWTPSHREMRVRHGKRTFRARDGKLVSAIVGAQAEEGARIVLRVDPVTRFELDLADDAADDRFEYAAVRMGAEGDVSAPVAGKREDADDAAHRRVSFGDVPQGRWRVQALLDEFVVGETVVDVDGAAGHARLTLTPLDTARNLVVRVEDADGRPAQDVTVELQCDDAESVNLHELRGRWCVVRTPDAAAAPFVVSAARGKERVSETVAAGRTGELVLRFPPVQALEVELPAGLHVVTLVGPDGSSDDASTDDWSAADNERVVRFEHPPSGGCELRSEDPRFGGGMRIRLPQAAPVRFVPRPFRARRVKSVEDESLAGAWGLAPGDLVVGINGEEFRNLLHMEALFAAAALRPDAVLEVERGSRRFRVTCDPGAIRAGDAGLEMEPATRE